MKLALSKALVGLLVLAGLTACSNASATDVAECEAREGKVVMRSFPYEGEGFWATDSGDLEYCELASGAVGTVYNEEITELDTGFFGDTEENIKIFRKCGDLNGRVYNTEVYSADQAQDRFVCVRDGRVKKLL